MPAATLGADRAGSSRQLQGWFLALAGPSRDILEQFPGSSAYFSAYFHKLALQSSRWLCVLLPEELLWSGHSALAELVPCGAFRCFSYHV